MSAAFRDLYEEDYRAPPPVDGGVHPRFHQPPPAAPGSPPPRSFPSLDRLRARTREKVETMTVKRVAQAVGMTPPSLARFLDGGPILYRSRRKLFYWLIEADLGHDLEAVACIRMIRHVLKELPNDQLDVTVRDILLVLRRHHLASTGSVPEWVRRGIDRLGTVNDLPSVSVWLEAAPQP